MSSSKSCIDANELSDSLTRHLVDELDEIVFVCDPDSYDLLYLNDFGKKTFKIESCSGKKCHEALFGHSRPCSFCKKKYLTLDEFFVWEQPVNGNHHYLIRDKLIRWEEKTLLFGVANNIVEKEIISLSIQRKLQNEQILLKCLQVLGNEEKFAEAVDIILGLLGEQYEADRAYIFEYNVEENAITSSNTHEWCADNVVPQIDNLQNVPLETFSLWMGQLENNSNIIIESINSIREDHPEDYELLRHQGIDSLMVVPLHVDGKVSGFIGVDNPRSNRNDYSLLRSLALVVTNEQKKNQMERKLLELSYVDKLTGLGNRNNYIQTLEQLEKIPPPNLGVVFIDLNGLKMVNDQLGHNAGDEYIKNLANVFRKHFREEDIYRIGGDEFVFLARRIGESVFKKRVDALKAEADWLFPDAISVGYVWREKNIKPSSMVQQADILMYENKKEYYLRRDSIASP